RDMISSLQGAVPQEAVEVVPVPVPAQAVGEAVEAAEEVEPVEKARHRSRRFVAGILGLGALLTVCLCSFLFIIVVSGSQERQPPIRPGETVTAVREDPAAHIYLARRYLQQGNIERAIAEYEVAIDFDPDAVDAYLGLGIILLA
ncbi:MAG: hypothetical protein CEE40_11470, partial [Chloroflexi bacterium B3_Chlor]